VENNYHYLMILTKNYIHQIQHQLWVLVHV